MTRRVKRLAPLFFRTLAVVSAATVAVVVGCAGEIIPPPPQCMGSACSCDDDPLQPLCKGFNDRPDGQVDMRDAMKIDTGAVVTPEAGPTDDAAADAPDEASDAADDGG
jgi:hypothetical protein